MTYLDYLLTSSPAPRLVSLGRPARREARWCLLRGCLVLSSQFPCLAFCPLLALAAAYAEMTMLAIAIADTISSGVIFTSSSFVYGLVGL